MKLHLFFRTLCVLLYGLTTFLLGNSSVCIVIPAYNEGSRIEKTLDTYATYFATKPEKTTLLVVANNCSDNTVQIATKVKNLHKNIEIIDLKPGGKGFAVKEGFLWATAKNHFDWIGFVDADMATLPQYFYDLIKEAKNCDGAIASRYAKGANVQPARPFIKKIGGKVYNWILRKRFGLPFKDTQCGAKIFSADTIKRVANDMVETGWSFDLELLYLCHLEGKQIKEVATTWSDQPGSHLEISTKLIKEFTSAPSRIKNRHERKRKTLKKEKLAEKKRLRALKKQEKKLKKHQPSSS